MEHHYSTTFADLDARKYRSERDALAAILSSPPLTDEVRSEVVQEAEALVEVTRRSARRQGVVESFLQEFSLSTREGLALMCLAEALLRTPDEDTRDRLIAEKIASADWASHLGGSDSLLVNASAFSLMLTGKLIEPSEDLSADLSGYVRRLAGRLGEPVIRRAVAAAVRIMGEQFVLGRTITAAIRRADGEGYVCSFDMLGEGARTEADADRYEAAYALAIRAVGEHSDGRGPESGHGVSVKLSALCARYEARHEDLVWTQLYPRLLRLAEIAAGANINLTLDAEEADRLVLSLKLLDRLAQAPALGAWKGLGLAVQAYQKRAQETVEAVAGIARRSGRRLMVRLVKGAYWDSEIKRAQVQGLPDFPVFTTKAATDLSYLACARALLAASPDLYPQFATHNARTLAAVRIMARQAGVSPEFQRLHGMGEALYAGAAARYGALKLRVYAPVGGHEDLLPYLVRRLLENGANTSFVHALLDERTPVSVVAADPIAVVEAAGGAPHARIAAPADLYGAARLNSGGMDLSVPAELERLVAAVEALPAQEACPIVGGQEAREGERQNIASPASPDQGVGQVWMTTDLHISRAFDLAAAAQPAWDRRGGTGRAQVLRAMGDELEAARDTLAALCVREAGKVYADAMAEVREAVDFCRYYAHLAERQFGGPQVLRGPVGEVNQLSLHGRGVIVAISPWNFPLAIFTGQVAAALAAGNGVIAKPAEQTPLIAAAAVRLFHKAGLPPDLLALAPGSGADVGARLTRHPLCAGVAFTGGTDTAWAINRALASRDGPIIPLVAETGGLNAMLVDTTALREQVVDDVIASAFGAAGQRCSALRILFAPEPTADGLVDALRGAMDALVIGDPRDPRTDVGPVIDSEARDRLTAHLDRLGREARVLHQARIPESGWFFPPTLAEIPSAGFLEREVFGPILHVVRYDPRRLDEALAPLRARGYGLTLGVHSRIEGFVQRARDLLPSGNTYVNRSMVGAVVGVQPFGGEGLSGTGPKAGGPHALLRFAVERAVSINIAAQGGDPVLLNLNA